MTGLVTRVDRDGEVKIDTGDGKYKMHLPAGGAQSLKKGHRVVVDTRISPTMNQ